MNLKLLIAINGAIIVVLICCIYSAACADAELPENNANQLTKHKLFDFSRFKSIFNKKYHSLAEELTRQKIFFANVFKAFLSFVGYKHGQSGTFMKIHDKSDWTKDELRMLEGRLSDETSPALTRETPLTEVADLNQIESELSNLVANDDGSNPLHAAIAKELKEMDRSGARRKRDISSSLKRSKVTLNDLFHEPKLSEKQNELRVPSNNDDYQPPEITSFGIEDTGFVPELSSLKSSVFGKIGDMINLVKEGITDDFNYVKGILPEIRRDPSLPDQVFVDHRQRGCLTEVKNQGQCGSCFIFSTTALFEWRYCQESGHKVSFSEQYPIDCGDRISMKGCSGGQEKEVSKFFGLFGVELRMNYPYRMHVDVCPYEKNTPIKKMGYLRVNGNLMKYIDRHEMEKYIDSGPIVIGLGVSDDFSHYGGGVDFGKKCDRSRGHSVLIVGHGREDGVEYWLIRNSYGPWWGDEGHYKIAKDATNCFLDHYQGGVLDPAHGRVFKEEEINPSYDGKSVRDHFVHYKPTSVVPKRPSDPSIATPPSF